MAVTSIKIALVICGLATFVATNEDRLRKESFDRIDLNKDGVLSSEDLHAEFGFLDANNDNAVTLVEIQRVAENIKQENFDFFDGLDGKVDGSMKKSAISDYIRTLDTNSDGVLSFEENFAKVKKE